MFIRTKSELLLGTHPYHISLNKKILDDSKSFIFMEGIRNVDGGLSNLTAPKTNETRITSKSLELVYDWILTLLNQTYRGWNFKIYNSWLANYSKGFKYIWNEVPVLLTFESDWKKAKIILGKISKKHTANISKVAAKNFKEVISDPIIPLKKTVTGAAVKLKI